MAKKHIVVASVLVLAALALALGALIFPWWTGETGAGRFEIDLRNMTMCFNNQCGSPKPLSGAGESAAPWAKVGIATLAASLVAAAIALAVALRLFRRTRVGVMAWLAGVLAAFAGVLAGLFVAFHPDFGDWTPSYGMACVFGGALAVVAMSIVAGASERRRR